MMGKVSKYLLITLVLTLMGSAAYILTISPHSYRKFTTNYYDTNPFTPQNPTNINRPIELAENDSKQILWGDTHVHTTYSMDAFYISLPLMHGSRGAFPPAFACDYARFISQIDFYVLTDHAESYTPRTWKDQVESIRQCNAISGEENPDLVAFIGWEWTQAGSTPDTHYGHHNVFFKDYKEGQIPDRPIAAGGTIALILRIQLADVNRNLFLFDPVNSEYYFSFASFLDTILETDSCPEGLPSNYLPKDCWETAATPAELYGKLDDWGFETEVIPHGTTWGFYTPQAASWEEYMSDQDNIRPDYSSMIEIYSGHGNSEEYLDFKEVDFDSNGEMICPEPTENYLPTCYQASVINKRRCLAEGKSQEFCEALAEQTKKRVNEMPGASGARALFGVNDEDWLDAGQARGAYLPAFNYRPKKSAQYGLALRNNDYEDEKERFKWGFIASSDTHTARAGHGFKQLLRVGGTEARGAVSERWRKLLNNVTAEKTESGLRTVEELNELSGVSAIDVERQASFWSLGGLMAVHSTGRDRESIWQAMKRKEVYATTGHRILLHFDLLENGSIKPMGSLIESSSNPTFRVKAMGSFKQLPGCPDYVHEALSEKRLQKIANGECYHPSDERHRLERIEVIKITPQNNKDEDPTTLIFDSWKTFECSSNQMQCEIEFTDDDFENGQRDVVYYVRVIEEDTLLVNGSNMRTQFDADGHPISIAPCYADYREDYEEECLGPGGHRAWSSPIFVDYKERVNIDNIVNQIDIVSEANEQSTIN
ncbi:MAG: hypothetical protein CMD96_05380 [Gammaproteobacteria bacterium]|nr:hypothetical protein [Gammaproteobacteria bacterium]